MKQILSIVLLIFPLFVAAQTKKNKQPKDSLRYYETQIVKLQKDSWDSLKQSQTYVQLQDNINRLRMKYKTASGAIFSGECMHSNYDDFNKSIEADGFPAMQETSLRLGFGFFMKEKRGVFEFFFVNGGLANKSKKGNEKIRAGMSNLFQMNFGYDLLNSNFLSIYPYAGLSLRSSYLKYKKPEQTNPLYTNITNLVITNQSVDQASMRIGCQFGLNIDFMLLKPGPKKEGLALFVRGGMDQPLWKDRYKIYGVKYDPGIKHGDWLVGFGIKLFGLN